MKTQTHSVNACWKRLSLHTLLNQGFYTNFGGQKGAIIRVSREWCHLLKNRLMVSFRFLMLRTENVKATSEMNFIKFSRPFWSFWCYLMLRNSFVNSNDNLKKLHLRRKKICVQLVLEGAPPFYYYCIIIFRTKIEEDFVT